MLKKLFKGDRIKRDDLLFCPTSRHYYDTQIYKVCTQATMRPLFGGQSDRAMPIPPISECYLLGSLKKIIIDIDHKIYEELKIR